MRYQDLTVAFADFSEHGPVFSVPFVRSVNGSLFKLSSSDNDAPVLDIPLHPNEALSLSDNGRYLSTPHWTLLKGNLVGVLPEKNRDLFMEIELDVGANWVKHENRPFLLSYLPIEEAKLWSERIINDVLSWAEKVVYLSIADKESHAFKVNLAEELLKIVRYLCDFGSLTREKVLLMANLLIEKNSPWKWDSFKKLTMADLSLTEYLLRQKMNSLSSQLLISNARIDKNIFGPSISSTVTPLTTLDIISRLPPKSGILRRASGNGRK